MAATLLGVLGVLGLTAQTGMIIQSQDDDFSVEKKILVDEVGNKSGLALFGDQRAITINALVPSSSAFSTRMAAAVTLTNSPGDFYRATPGAGCGDIVLTGVKQGKKNDDFHAFSLELWSSDAFNIA